MGRKGNVGSYAPTHVHVSFWRYINTKTWERGFWRPRYYGDF